MSRPEHWLSVSAWAASLGISRQAAHKAIKRGGIPVVDGRVEATKAQALYEATTRRMVRSKPPTTTMPAASHGTTERVSYDEARRRQAVAAATREELELAARQGELVRAADVRVAFAGRMLRARDRLLAMSARLAPVLASETDAGRIASAIDHEVELALGELAAGGGA